MAVDAREYIPVTKPFQHVGPQLWRCSGCGRPGSYANPLDFTRAPDPDGPYSHLFRHRNGCAA